jgi:hypothetical protein
MPTVMWKGACRVVDLELATLPLDTDGQVLDYA